MWCLSSTSTHEVIAGVGLNVVKLILNITIGLRLKDILLIGVPHPTHLILLIGYSFAEDDD